MICGFKLLYMSIFVRRQKRLNMPFWLTRNKCKASTILKEWFVLIHYKMLTFLLLLRISITCGAQSTNAFFATVNQMFGGSSQLPTVLFELCSSIWFDYCAFGNSRKLGGAAEHLIDGSEKRICRLIFEFRSPYVIERRSNLYSLTDVRSGNHV